MSSENIEPVVIKEIMNNIEVNGEKKVKNLITQTNDIKSKEFGESLINIMKEGACEFKEKTGRNMTYSEMREMFG